MCKKIFEWNNYLVKTLGQTNIKINKMELNKIKGLFYFILKLMRKKSQENNKLMSPKNVINFH
jgi:hypothetical protein